MTACNEEKYAAEITFWRDEIARYVRWYNRRTREMYGIPAPTDDAKVVRHATIEHNAIETWINADRWRYCKHLMVEPTYFSGKRVLEVGCGPLGLSRWFAGATVHLLDPLLDVYDSLGYPPAPGIRLQCHAEDIPAATETFDSIVSVNAIDHVDDFEAAIAELHRVLTADGELRIEVHYHAKTVTEPVVLDDARVAAAFNACGMLGMQKISEEPSTTFYPAGTHPKQDRFVVWSNRTHIWRADRALKG
jgi:cyclopropane fatty-acyl-phospholipid synthase-like methyltransferase